MTLQVALLKVGMIQVTRATVVLALLVSLLDELDTPFAGQIETKAWKD